MDSIQKLTLLREFHANLSANLLEEVAHLNVGAPGLSLQIEIYQNHSSVMFERYAKSLAAIYGAGIEFKQNGYDDSLSFTQLRTERLSHSLYVLWLDLDRYTISHQSESWLKSKIMEFVDLSGGTCGIFLSSRDYARAETLRNQLNSEKIYLTQDFEGSNLALEAYAQDRLEKYTGSYLTKEAQLGAALAFTDEVIRSLFGPIKLIVVDLDWTLYSGVLSEDGPAGIKLETEHLELWRVLETAKKCGVLLAISSKNHVSDVEEFFELYSSKIGFVLTDFVHVAANYNDKSSNISEIIEKVQTVDSQTVFVDDNAGEIEQVLLKHPHIRIVVGNSGLTTAKWLERTPALNLKRIDDFANERLANLQWRFAEMSTAADGASGQNLSDIGAQVRIGLSSPEDLPRVADMSIRTNQFNSNLERIDFDQLSRLVESNAIQWATASLSDRFTNSGIICSVVAQQQDEIMNIRNLTLSCRALGRGIEKQIVSKTLLDLISRNSSTSISIPWVRGPRNSEFFNWAKAMRPSASFEEDEGVLILSKPELERAVEFESKKIEWL